MPDRLTSLRLAAATPCDPRTARAWLAGRTVRTHYLETRLAEAARAIGVERASAPPSPPEGRGAA